MLEHRVGSDHHARRRLDKGHADFTPPDIGHADHRHLGDTRTGEYLGFHLGWVDVFPTGYIHFFLAAAHGEESFRIATQQAAGAKPAVAHRRIGRRGVIEVAPEYGRT